MYLVDSFASSGRRDHGDADPGRAGPAGLQYLSQESTTNLTCRNDQLLFFATPMVFAFATWCALQIGAPDVRFPRLTRFSFWVFLSAD